MSDDSAMVPPAHGFTLGGDRMTAVHVGSFAEYLSGLDEAALTALVQARPDVRVQPVPRGFSQLAQRLSSADSLVLALRSVDRDTLMVGQAIAAVGESATVAGLVRLLGAAEHLVRAAVAVLCVRGLAWNHDGMLCLPERLQAHWSAEIGGGRPVAKIARTVLAEDLRAAVSAFGVPADGLRKPELTARLGELMADPVLLAEVVRQLPKPAKERLSEFRHGFYGYYAGFGRPRAREAADPTGSLMAAGLLLPVNGRPELPREVAVAGWLGEREFTLTGRPDLPQADSDESAVRRAAQAAVQETVRGLTVLLDHARARPIAALKKGGVGPRERERLAKRLSLPQDVLPLWIDVAYTAGLLAQTGGGYAPTNSYAEWRDGQTARQWAVLVDAWFCLEHAPTNREIDDDRAQPPPLPLASAAGLLRRVLLSVVRSGASLRAAGEKIDWFCPLHGYDAEQRADRIAAAIREAELFGVSAMDVVSEFGEHLLAVTLGSPQDRVQELTRRCAALLPHTPCRVILQSDLTAVVTGQPTAAVSSLLSDAAVAETHSGASTWRFTPASIRAALDAGWTAQDLLAELRAITDRTVPQPLEYLITDAARRHGTVRVRGMRSCVIADEASITEILHTRTLKQLHLSRLAPTVLASPRELDDVLTSLRQVGLSPMAEDAQGTAIVETRRDHEAAQPGHAPTTTPAQQLSATDLARQLAADPHGEAARPTADSGTFEVLAQHNNQLDEAELELLSHAVDHHTDVLICYRDKKGNHTIREIQPQQIFGKWIDSWCHLRNDQRDFTIANIESVSPTR